MSSTAPPRRRFGPRAFTLIELLVVIVILGILMAVAVPTFLRQQTKAQDSRTQQYLTTAFKAIRASTPETNNLYPQSTSMVSWITQSEPELSSSSGSCTTQVQTAPADKVIVDSTSASTSLTLCARSQSGNIWKLTASNTGVQQLLDGTLVALTESGGVITDALRSEGTSKTNIVGHSYDGRENDSSTGVWGQTTNLVVDGGAETAGSAWGVGGAETLVRTAGAGLFGNFGYVASCTGGCGYVETNSADPTVSASTVYTYSMWVKQRAGAASQQVQPYVQEYNGGTFVKNDFGSTQTVGSSWSRLAVTFTTNASTNLVKLAFQQVGGSTGNAVSIDGIQLEQSAFASPYVETTTAAATRAGSVVQAPVYLLDATQGWVAARVRIGRAMSNALGSTWPRVFAWGLNGENAPRSSFDLYYDGTAGMWGAEVYNNGSPNGANTGGTNSSVYTGSGSEYATLIMTWTASQVGISLNGASFNTAARTVGIPASMDSTFEIGALTASAYPFDGDILWFACGQGTFSNADAVTINGWGSSDPKLAAFPAAAQATMVWNGVGATGSLK